MTTVTITAPIASLQAVVERRAPGAVRTAGAVTAATADQATRPVLPVRPDLAALLPAGGLPLGSTVAVDGSSRLLLIMLAATTAAGSWAAIVGLPDLGLLAAHDCDVVLERLAIVPNPGSRWAIVVDALLDGLDIDPLFGGNVPRQLGSSQSLIPGRPGVVGAVSRCAARPG